MKIIDQSKPSNTFGVLQVGDVFKYGSSVYMKMAFESTNAVDLEVGFPAKFSENTAIVRVEHELIIK